MSTNLIGVGTAADDGTGDTLRAACQAINTIIQKADASSAQLIHVFEDTSDGTNKCIITAGAMASDRTLTCPTGGDLALEDLRVFAHIPASAGVAASQKFYENATNGTSYAMVTAPDALSGNVTITLPTTALDLSSVATIDSAWIDGVTTTGTAIRVLEPPDSGTNYCAIRAEAMSSNRLVQLPTGGDLDLEKTRVLVSQYTAAAAGQPDKLALLEPQGGGTDTVTIQAPALSASVTFTLPASTFDMANVVGITPTAASAGTGASIGLPEPTGGGASVLTIVAPALAGNVTWTGPATTFDMANVLGITPTAASAGTGASIGLPEPTGGGASVATVVAPALSGNVTITLPDATTDFRELFADNTDGRVEIPILDGLAEAGTWTPAVADGLITIARTAGASVQEFWVMVPHPNRTAANKGIKPTGLVCNYLVATEDADDVRFELWRRTQGAHGAAPTAAVLGGQSDAHYDANHDTAAKRGTQAHRCATVTLPTPAFLGAGESMILRVYVDDQTGGASVVTLRMVELLYTEDLIDQA